MNKHQEALYVITNKDDVIEKEINNYIDKYNEHPTQTLINLINRNEDLELLVMSLRNGKMRGKMVAPETLEASAIYDVTFTLFDLEYDFLIELLENKNEEKEDE